MPSLRSHRLGDLTSPEVAATIADGLDAVLLPVGSTEQHGAHLPLSTDSLHTFEILERAAVALPALVAPLLPIGRAEHHMAFAGTLSVRQETLQALVEDCCESLFRHGFRHVLVYSGHGGNAAPLAMIVAGLKEKMPGRSIIGCTDWAIYEGALFPAAEALGVPKFAAGWHAGELETSMILALDGRLVLMGRASPGFIGDLAEKRAVLMAEGVQAVAPSGVVGDPTLADVAHGERYLEALAAAVTGFFRDALKTARQATAA